MSQLDSVGIAKQTAFGSAASSSEYFLDAESATVDGKPDRLQPVSTVGYKFPQMTDPGLQTWKVSMDILPRAASMPKVFQFFFGDPTASTVDTSATKHAFDPVAAAGSVKYATLFLSRNDPGTAIVDKIAGCRGQTLTVSCTKGDYVKASASFLGASRSSVAAPTPTLDSTERFTWDDVKLYANVDGGGEAELKVSDFTFTYDTQLEDDHMVLGSASLASIPVGTSQTATFDFTLEEEDATAFATWYGYAIANSSRPSIVYRIAVGGTLIGATTVKAGFEIKMWNAEVLDAPANISASARLRNIVVSNKCNYDLANTKFVSVDAYNLVSGYTTPSASASPSASPSASKSPSASASPSP